MTARVDSPTEFQTAFTSLIASVDRLLTGTARLDAEAEPFCFELAAARERPVEFFQCLLDLVRVIYEPQPPGTMLLNSNWDLVADAVPLERFDLGYASVSGKPGERIDTVIARLVRPRLALLDYDVRQASGIFVCVLAGKASWRDCLKLVSTASREFSAGFTVETAARAIVGDSLAVPSAVVGAALDESMACDQLRVSLLLYLPPRPTKPQRLN